MKQISQKGHTLVEMAVALVILGILGILLVRWIQLQSTASHEQSSNDLLLRSDDAIVAFAARHGRLPCPATENSGKEDCNGSAVGKLPYITLGLPDLRAGQLRYGVLRAEENNAQDADLATLKDRSDVLQVLVTGSNVASLVQAHPGNHLNTLDLCRALHQASRLPVRTDLLHLISHEDGSVSPESVAAYAIAMVDTHQPAPYHLGQSLGFASPLRVRDSKYQDRVVAAGPDQLWSRLRCADSIGPALHAQANLAAAAAVMVPAMDDYHEQLRLMVAMAEANDKSADAALFAGAAQITSATAGLLDAIGETTGSNFLWAFRIPFASAGVGTAVSVLVAAGIMKSISARFVGESVALADEFGRTFPAEAKKLHLDLQHNARQADIEGIHPTQQP